MDRIHITGGQPLHGSLPISGAKNAALPLLIAAMLTREPVTLENVPHLADVAALQRILSNHGVDIMTEGKRPGQKKTTGQTLRVNAESVVDTTAPYELVSRMRASFWVIGPLLARFGEAKVSMPGGCAIGTRPVDFFLSGLRALGAHIDIEGGYVLAKAPRGLIGAEFRFPNVSVGATHVMMMAASLAQGTTVLHNAAREPEVVDVAELLIKMGAKISGHGTRTITIHGVARLSGARHRVLPDRIETGTYAMAVAATGGNVLLEGADGTLLSHALAVLKEVGVHIEQEKKGLRVVRDASQVLRPVQVTTEPYPGFPTDLQAQLMALLCFAQGRSVIRETIFENRFMHVQELVRMGARIELKGDSATIEGVSHLTGAPVMATDLRASVSLIIAGLAAEGQTILQRIYHLDRGFDNLESKLRSCGAQIERVAE